VRPRYDQRKYNTEDLKNEFVTVVNPDREGGLYIHQDAWLSIGDFDAGSYTYQMKGKNTGTYFFIMEGEAIVAGKPLKQRDAMGVTGVDQLDFSFSRTARILAIEVPLQW
jgi:hypothetical protein